MGEVICPKKKCRGEKCVYLTRFEEINKNTYQCKQCKACSHVLNFPSKDQEPRVTLFGWTYCFRKKTKSDFQRKNSRPYCDSTSSNQNSPRQNQRKLILNLFQKKQKYYLIWNNRVTLLLSLSLQHKITFLFIFQIFLQPTTRFFTINTMQFPVSINGT